MRRSYGLRPAHIAWLTSVLAAGVLLAGGPASANPVALDPAWLDSDVQLAHSAVLLLALLNLVVDLLALWAVGRLVGIFRRGGDLGLRFLWWGGAIWAGGLVADALALHRFPHHYLPMVATAMGLIFAWNLLLALWPARAAWRGLVVAAGIAILTAPYLGGWPVKALGDFAVPSKHPPTIEQQRHRPVVR